VTEKHDGKLYCHSEPGKDSELVVEIPVRQARLGLDTGWLVIEQIARFTELSVEQLQQLQNQMIQE
nr:hypothetical protein [Oculatellaceae cyanobacterium Prado106]